MRWKSDRRALGDVEGNRWEMSEGSDADALRQGIVPVEPDTVP